MILLKINRRFEVLTVITRGDEFSLNTRRLLVWESPVSNLWMATLRSHEREWVFTQHVYTKLKQLVTSLFYTTSLTELQSDNLNEFKLKVHTSTKLSNTNLLSYVPRRCYYKLSALTSNSQSWLPTFSTYLSSCRESTFLIIAALR